VLLKSRLISIDAANRAWMQGATYRDALGAGTVMAARGVGEVIESATRTSRPETWRSATAAAGIHRAAGTSLMKQPDITPLSHLLSVYGVSGLTAISA